MTRPGGAPVTIALLLLSLAGATASASSLSDLLSCPCSYEGPRRLYARGLAAGRQGRFALACRRFEQALGEDPFAIPARRGLDLAHDAEAGRARPATARLLFDVIATAERRGWAAALPLAREAVRLQPSYYYAHHEVAAALFELGEHEASLAEAALALVDRADYSYTHNNRGLALDRLGRAGEALEAYRRAVDLDPRHYKAYKNIGAALIFAGRADEGREWLERALDIYPEYAFAYEQWKSAGAPAADADDAWRAEATSALTARLRSGSWRERRRVVTLLRARCDPSAERALLTLLQSSGPLSRYQAVEGIETLHTPKALTALARAAGDEDFVVRRRASEALAAMGSERACSALGQAYGRERSDLVRSAQAHGLARCQWPDAAKTLLQGVTDPSRLGRNAARTAVIEAAGWDRIARGEAPRLVCLLADERPQLRTRVIEALTRISRQDLGDAPERWRQWCVSQGRCRRDLTRWVNEGICQ